MRAQWVIAVGETETTCTTLFTGRHLSIALYIPEDNVVFAEALACWRCGIGGYLSVPVIQRLCYCFTRDAVDIPDNRGKATPWNEGPWGMEPVWGSEVAASGEQ
jgi:hypothetical protein